MTETVLYGIDTCDQVRLAKRWLRTHGIEVRYHDFRREGLTAAMLQRWLTRLPWDALLNRRGLAWRKLDPAVRQQVVDQASAVEVLLADPTLIKRPVVETGERLLVGFSEQVYRSTFEIDEP